MKIIFWISSFLIFYTYLIYPGILWAFFRRKGLIYNHELSAVNGDLPFVTILVSAHNEEKVIDGRIHNLLELDYPKEKLEIIIASDGSDDNTDNIVKGYNGKGVRLVSFKERMGKVNVLNNVIPESRGEIIVLSDANTVFKKSAVKILINRFSDKRIGCVCGELNFRKNSGVENLEGVYWRYEQFLKGIEGARGSLLGANGGIYAIRKELFQKIPADTIVEDFVIPMHILEKGKKVIYEPEAIAFEDAGKVIVQELARRIRIGAGDFQALTLTWRMLNPLKGFSAFAFISHKVIRWLVPFFMIFAFFTNLALSGALLYKALFAMQIIFYLLAVTGRVLVSAHLKARFAGLPYYFVSMNLGLFFGFVKFCFRRQKVTWDRTER